MKQFRLVRCFALSARATLRHWPFAFAASSALSLAVGATVAVYSVSSPFLSPRAEVGNPEQLAVAYYPVPASAEGEMLDHFRFDMALSLSQLPVFESVAIELSSTRHFGDWRPTVRETGRRINIETQAVNRNYFSTLGVQINGDASRFGFGAEADLVGVVSQPLWSRLSRSEQFEPGVVLSTQSGDIRIVGTVPVGFRGARLGDQFDLWIPLDQLSTFSDLMSAPGLRKLAPVSVICRLRSGVTIQEAEAQVRRLAPRTAVLKPFNDLQYRWRSVEAVERQRNVSIVHWSIAGLVLIFGTATFGTLVSLRLSGRRQELALRAALGAPSTEPLVLIAAELIPIAIIGATGGVLLSQVLIWSVGGLELPSGVRVNTIDTGLRWSALAFGLALGTLCTCVGGYVSYRRFSSPVQLLRSAATGDTAGRSMGVNALLFVQACVSVILVTVTGVMAAKVVGASIIAAGFATDELLYVFVRPRLTQYDLNGADNSAARLADYRRLISDLAALPGISAVSTGLPTLVEGPRPAERTFVVDGRRERVPALVAPVGVRYVETIGLTLKSGTSLAFQRGDGEAIRSESAPRNVVVDEVFARRMWGADAALGRSFSLAPSPWRYHVVGVSVALTSGRPGDPASGVVLVDDPGLDDDGSTGRNLVLRTNLSSAALKHAVALRIERVFPAAAIVEIRSAEDIKNANLASERMAARAFIWYGGASLILVLSGLVGLVALFMNQRRRELAVKCALGATDLVLQCGAVARVVRPFAGGALAGAFATTVLAETVEATLPSFDGTYLLFSSWLTALMFVLCAVVATWLATVRQLKSIESNGLFRPTSPGGSL